MELCLGTAQFGMDYGIQGARKPAKETIFEILEHAFLNGISTIDTANSYGNAETILGDYYACTSNSFHIITKLSYDIFKSLPASNYLDTALYSIENSLTQLKIPRLRGLLFHNPSYLYDENAVNTLYFLKESGFTESIGVSVYDPKDAYYALELEMDIIQVPVNLFDRRFDLFIENAPKETKIFARSVYLQGLLLMDIEGVTKKLPIAEEYVKKLDQLCENYHYSRRDIALAYIKSKKGIASMIFGVDSLQQLKENVAAYHQQVPIEIIDEISTYFKIVGEDIVSPIKWKKT